MSQGLECFTSVYSVKEDEDDKSSNRQNLESKKNLTSITNENFTKTGTTLYRYSYSNYLSLLITIVGISLISLSLDDKRNTSCMLYYLSLMHQLLYIQITLKTHKLLGLIVKLERLLETYVKQQLRGSTIDNQREHCQDASIESYPRHEAMPPIIKWNDIASSPPNIHHTRSYFTGEASRNDPLMCELQ